MDGPQDLGGRAGFGPVDPEPDEPVFHGDWERRALGVTLACGALGYWSIDESRHARECIAPSDYYTSSYYGIWTRALERLLIHHGEVSAEELSDGQMLQPGLRSERRLSAAMVPDVLARGGPCERQIDLKPAFKVGDKIRTIKAHPSGHTRLPAYARDKLGTVGALCGAHVFPDTNAHDLGEQPCHLYTLVFEGCELWGADSEPGLTVSIDAWESYFEHA